VVEQPCDLYLEETQSIAEQRTGHGIIMVTTGGQVLLMDNRAAEFCQQMQVDGDDQTETLPTPIVKIVKEIAELLEFRTHSKDWENFQVKRVIEGQAGSIFVAGIGLPANVGHDTIPTILLTLDIIVARATSFRRLDEFLLTPKEKIVVEYLLKGYTNKEIAQATGVKGQTAKEHVKHIMEKTKTSTRTGAIMAIAGPRP